MDIKKERTCSIVEKQVEKEMCALNFNMAFPGLEKR